MQQREGSLLREANLRAIWTRRWINPCANGHGSGLNPQRPLKCDEIWPHSSLWLLNIPTLVSTMPSHSSWAPSEIHSGTGGFSAIVMGCGS